MDSLFNEGEADKRVIDSLLNTNLILWRELEHSREMVHLLRQSKQGTVMQKKILQDLNGGLVIAKEFEELTYEEAMKLYEHFKENITVLEKFLFKKAASADPAANGGDNGPADNAAADQAGSAGVNQPAPSDQAQGDQAGQAAPADQQPAPAAPALDANGNVIQPAPAGDPNQPPAQPEQPVMPPLQ